MFCRFKCFCSRNNRYRNCRNINNIDVDKMAQMQRDGAILIDVRSPQEFDEGHLFDAICVPEYELTLKIRMMIPNMDEVLILYCGTGHRSERAKQRLRKMGYANVYNLRNGLENY